MDLPTSATVALWTGANVGHDCLIPIPGFRAALFSYHCDRVLLDRDRECALNIAAANSEAAPYSQLLEESTTQIFRQSFLYALSGSFCCSRANVSSAFSARSSNSESLGFGRSVRRIDRKYLSGGIDLVFI